MRNTNVWTRKDDLVFEKFVKNLKTKTYKEIKPLQLSKKTVTKPPYFKMNDVEKQFLPNLESIAASKIIEIQKEYDGDLKKLQKTNPTNNLHKEVIAYSIKEKEEYYRLWLRYWLRVSGYQTESTNINAGRTQQAREFPIYELLQDVKRVGSKFCAPCPFHQEKNASFYIYPDNSWHCFGCGAHGNNAIDFMKRLEPDKSFLTIVQELS
jgi:hypothetical protein